MTQISLKEIIADFDIAFRDEIDWETVKRYQDNIDALPPLTVVDIDGEYHLADGFHRYHALLQLERDTAEVDLTGC